jgi:mitogen-activated protein kinase kinase
VPLSATTKRRNRRRSKGVSLHGSQATLSILELMHAIINEPSPRLPRNKFDKEVEDFVGGCLEKDPEKRGQGGLGALFVSCFCFVFLKFRKRGRNGILIRFFSSQEYPWIRHSRTNGVDMRAWAATF